MDDGGAGVRQVPSTQSVSHWPVRQLLLSCAALNFASRFVLCVEPRVRWEKELPVLEPSLSCLPLPARCLLLAL